MKLKIIENKNVFNFEGKQYFSNEQMTTRKCKFWRLNFCILLFPVDVNKGLKDKVKKESSGNTIQKDFHNSPKKFITRTNKTKEWPKIQKPKQAWKESFSKEKTKVKK